MDLENLDIKGLKKIDLDDLTVKGLRKIIREHNYRLDYDSNYRGEYIRGYSKMKKSELVKKVNGIRVPRKPSVRKTEEKITPKKPSVRKTEEKITPKKPSVRKTEGKPRVGDIVKIIVKPYDKGIKINGIVKKVLTKKEVHTQGHKVMLRDGTVGRLVKILKRNV